jgi:polysaccharide pyruvyl transferase WcaK-like protein
MRLHIFNVFGSNRGDEAMLSSVGCFVRQRFPSLEVRAFSTNWLDLQRHEIEVRKRIAAQAIFAKTPSLISRLLGPAAVAMPALLPAQDMTGLLDADVFLSGPAGPYLGDQIGLRHAVLLPIAQVARAKKPFAILATSGGPFTSSVNRNIRRRLLGKAEFWSLREETSFEHARGLDLGIPLHVGTDLVFAHPSRRPDEFLDGAQFERFAAITRWMKRKPTTVVTLNRTDYFEPNGRRQPFDVRGYTTKVLALLRHVLATTRGQILLMPHFYGQIGELEMLLTIQHALAAEFAISHRYHPTIFAARVATPFLCIRHEFKVDGMLQEFEPLGPVTITPDPVKKWGADFDRCWIDRAALRARLEEKIGGVEKKATMHLDLLDAFLRKHGAQPAMTEALAA